MFSDFLIFYILAEFSIDAAERIGVWYM